MPNANWAKKIVDNNQFWEIVFNNILYLWTSLLFLVIISKNKKKTLKNILELFIAAGNGRSRKVPFISCIHEKLKGIVLIVVLVWYYLLLLETINCFKEIVDCFALLFRINYCQQIVG